jgi:single-strand DNA-binding protein
MSDANSLNKVILVGHLGQKPELRTTNQGIPTARFTLATNERRYNRTTGQSTDHTEWHRIIAWRKLAEFCDKYLDKGRQVLIEGKLRTRSWNDRDGNKRTSTEVEAERIVFLGGRREGAPESGYTPDAPAVPDFPGEEDPSASGEGEGHDEVPF